MDPFFDSLEESKKIVVSTPSVETTVVSTPSIGRTKGAISFISIGEDKKILIGKVSYVKIKQEEDKPCLAIAQLSPCQAYKLYYSCVQVKKMELSDDDRMIARLLFLIRSGLPDRIKFFVKGIKDIDRILNIRIPTLYDGTLLHALIYHMNHPCWYTGNCECCSDCKDTNFTMPILRVYSLFRRKGAIPVANRRGELPWQQMGDVWHDIDDVVIETPDLDGEPCSMKLRTPSDFTKLYDQVKILEQRISSRR